MVFTAGTTAAEVTAARNGNDLQLTIVGTTDVLTIQGWFLSPNNQIDRFEFADGTLLPRGQELTDSLLTQIPGVGASVLGTAGADVLTSSGATETLYGLDGDDTLTGGSGDLLVGGAGNDTYNYRRGDGQVAIYDYDSHDAHPEIYGPTLDRVVFESTISASDVALSRAGNDLLLTVNGGSDRLTLRNWFVGANYQPDSCSPTHTLPGAARSTPICSVRAARPAMTT